MADKTGIAYVHHTHNEWWGCSAPAGAGCVHCYAAQMDKWVGGHYFGLGTRPRITKEQNRNRPYRWNRDAAASGERRRVLCGSMMDVGDRYAPEGAFRGLMATIRATAALDWILLTKRPTNLHKLLPADWGDNGYLNAWVGTTVENRKSGLRRLEQLRDVPAVLRVVSFEPLLEDLGDLDLSGIGWGIVGGESGSGCRAMPTKAAERVINQYREQGIPIFFKQNGGRTADAGGCLFNGTEIKEYPISPAALAAGLVSQIYPPAITTLASC